MFVVKTLFHLNRERERERESCYYSPGAITIIMHSKLKSNYMLQTSTCVYSQIPSNHNKFSAVIVININNK